MTAVGASVSYSFRTRSSVDVGIGLFRNLGQWLRAHGYEEPLVLLDSGFAATELSTQACRSLERHLPNTSVQVVDTHLEPTYDLLEAVRAAASEVSFDVVVGVGGGSCMDVAKAVAVLVRNEGPALDYRGFDLVKNPGVPTVLVPTTAGTGSEASFNASFVDAAAGRKLGINGAHMFATWALLDAETTVTCPTMAAIGACVDAITHAVEGFVCRAHNDFSDALAMGALRLIIPSARTLVAEEVDLSARERLLVGAYMAGQVQMTSGSGVAAALSYPLSAHFNVPHGIGGGLFLLDVAEWNHGRGYYRLADLADVLLPPGAASGSREQDSAAVIRILRELWRDLGVPVSLEGFGISSVDFDRVCQLMLTQQAAFDQNPVPFSAGDDAPVLLQPFFVRDAPEARTTVGSD